MTTKKQKDLLKVAKREKYFSTLARKEGKGAAERAQNEQKRGLKAAAADSRWEHTVDERFAKIRADKAKQAKIKAKK